ncbi:MAG: signal recognition particle-docking protein FtsY [Clostridia bacterium]|nr:signal recognition particle-docking protein FtsY [Clostridia bacterium]
MGFFDKLKRGLAKTKSNLSEKINDVFAAFVHVDEELFEELEETLITADVGVETTDEILDNLRNIVKHKNITDPNLVKQELISILTEILSKADSSMNLSTTPSIVIIVGVNGVGKTTSIGKIAHYYKSQGKKVLLAAADTFRAAAADQLEIWANRAEVDIIRHNEGADPGAVVFDAITAAKKRGSEIILCDTAGRLHNKKNLMDELNKIIRIADRELPNAAKEVLLVLDATTGQNALQQAKLFDASAGLTGLILTKLDGTAKGGVVIGLSNEQNLPVKFVGVGEQIDDLQPFDPNEFSKVLFSQDD